MMRVLALLAACSSPSGGRPGETSAPEPMTTTPPAPVPTATTTTTAPIAVCINEVVPDNEHGWRDETGADPDWVELHNPGDVRIDLDGWRLGQDPADRDGAPLDGLSIEPGGYLVLAADGLPDLGTTHLPFQLSGAGEVLALWSPDDAGSIVAFGATAADRALARETDCCEADSGCWIPTLRPTPGASNAGSLLPTVLVDRGATWRYTEAPPAGNWASPGFDDSGWTTGPAPLGFGEVVATELDGGDPLARPLGAWFRTTFSVADPGGLTAVRSRLRYDDGVVVYLNGTRIFAVNAPETPGAYATGLREEPLESRWHEAEVWRSALIPGDNLLAVAIAQGAADSADLRFELELRAAP